MKAEITGIVPSISQRHGNMIYNIYFRDEAGNDYRSFVDPSYKNYSRWKPIIEGRQKGLWLAGLNLLAGNKVDADSKFVTLLNKDNQQLSLLEVLS